MNNNADDTQRNIIPQWLDSREKEAVKATLPSKPQPSEDQKTATIYHELQKIIAAWKEFGGMGHAAELISAAVTYNRYELAEDAAHFALAQEHRSTESISRLAKRVLGADDAEDVNEAVSIAEQTRSEAVKAIREGRGLIKIFPANPMVLVDIARGHTILGQPEKAERAMGQALRLAPQHRPILRAASRLYQLRKNPLRGLLLLRRQSVTQNDPWLVAAELALSKAAEQPPRLVRSGRNLLEFGDFHPFHTSELAAALASLELANGKDRRARQLFRLSLREPTQNSVAQAAWAERQQSSLSLLDEDLSVPDKYLSSEARFFALMQEQDWEECIRAAWSWLHSEPFSTRPVLFGSQVATIAISDHRTSKQLIETGLRADPDDRRLLLQATYVYGSAGDTENAEKYLGKLRLLNLSSKEKIILTANEGLVAYRRNRVEEARRKYMEATLQAAQVKNEPSFSLNALLHFAREEKTIDGEYLPYLLPIIDRLKDVPKNPVLDALIKNLLSNT